MKNLVEFFPLLAICLHAKINVIQSLHQEICDQRILQSNWLEAVPAITQG